MKKSEYEKMYLLENSHFWFVGKRYFIQAYLNIIKSRVDGILDLGCGTGGTTKFLQRYGKVTGVEKNPSAIFLAKKRGIKIVKGDAEDLPYKKDSFDLITLFDVLYHKDVKNVEKAVKEVRKVLKPTGFLLITDSAFDILKSSHGVSVFEGRRFTLKNLEYILNKSGFEIIKSSYIFLSIFPLILFKRFFVDKLIKSESDLFRPPEFVNLLLKLILKAEALLLNYLKLPLGSSLIILAKK